MYTFVKAINITSYSRSLAFRFSTPDHESLEEDGNEGDGSTHIHEDKAKEGEGVATFSYVSPPDPNKIARQIDLSTCRLLGTHSDTLLLKSNALLDCLLC